MDSSYDSMIDWWTSVTRAGSRTALPTGLFVPFGLSLQKVLEFLASPLFSSVASTRRKLEKAVFLIVFLLVTDCHSFMPSLVIPLGPSLP